MPLAAQAQLHRYHLAASQIRLCSLFIAMQIIIMPQGRQHVGPWGLATPQISCLRVYGMQLAILASCSCLGGGHDLTEEVVIFSAEFHILYAIQTFRIARESYHHLPYHFVGSLRIVHASARCSPQYVPSRVADRPAPVWRPR
eukprot:scaffold243722_cov17-Prasinocladus_malaysianus.AAC.1